MLLARELRDRRAQLIEEAAKVVKAAETEDRDLTDAESADYATKITQAQALLQRAERLESLGGMGDILTEKRAPVVNKIPRGDNEARAVAHYIRSGDAGGLGRMEVRASNNTDMNIGTDADGGYAVPTGHYQGIIARRDEMMLARKLGVRNIPGRGTTVNVPLDGEADGEFVVTTEANAADRDAPALGQAAMTLAWYSKKVQLSYQLLNDEDSRLLDFLTDFVARGLAKTHNSLLITEAAANGTSLKTFAASAAIAAGEPEDIIYNNDMADYLDDSNSVAWVTRAASFGDIASLTGNARLYAETPGGAGVPRATLLGYPVAFSQKVAAIGGGAKSIYFGNWNFMGMREAPGLSFLRDPYGAAGNLQVNLYYWFAAVYKVLQAEAIGYGVHPTS